MSIVRVGLGEEKSFASGYEAIFGKATRETKKKPAPAPKAKAPAKPAAKPVAKAKKPVAKAKRK